MTSYMVLPETGKSCSGFVSCVGSCWPARPSCTLPNIHHTYIQYIHGNTYIHTCTHFYIYTHIYIHTYIQKHSHTHEHINEYIYIYIYTYIYIHIFFICIYVFIDIYNIYIYIYVYYMYSISCIPPHPLGGCRPPVPRFISPTRICSQIGLGTRFPARMHYGVTLG